MISPSELTHKIVEEHRHWLLNNAGDVNEVDACHQFFDQRLGARRRIKAKKSICASINRRQHADAAKREAALRNLVADELAKGFGFFHKQAGEADRPDAGRYHAATIPKMIEVKLTHNDAWVVLRALAAYDAKDEKTPGSKAWVAERLLQLVQPAVRG